MSDLTNNLEDRRAAKAAIEAALAKAFAEAGEYLENLNLNLNEIEEDEREDAPCQK